MYTITHKEGKARIGKLETAHGTLETPFFMPVLTKGATKHVSHNELYEMNTECMICNAFILYLTPGLDVIKKFGGIHKFINWKKPAFTDSGGFQMLKKSFLIQVSRKGVHFRSPFDSSKHIITPEKAIEIQNIINSDVAMCLDFVPHYGNSKEYMETAMNKTHEWAKRCKAAHKNPKQLLFGITQGGTFKDLREESAKFLNNLNFDGYSIGGLCIGEGIQKTMETIDWSTPHLNENKPRYLMGAGSPMDLVEGVYHGIDIFDSIYPTRHARHGQIFTSKGNILIKKVKHKEDPLPLDPDCDCFVCKQHSRAYIHHLLKNKNHTAFRLVSYHNLYFIQQLIQKIRKAIKGNQYEEFRNDFIKRYKK
jgi:queuine tRNA-ribosyltransferase